MEIDPDKVDEAVIGLLYLTMFEASGVTRAWKGHDWAVLNRLHEQGYLFDPRNKARSVILTDDGKKRAKETCMRLFGRTG